MIKLSSIDLNLLVALDALFEEGSVTRAADKVGLSQSAMSHKLSRLRHLFGDPLFTRVGNQMHPTATAQKLRTPLSKALRQLQRALDEEAAIQLGMLERTFHVLASSDVQLALMPKLAAALAQHAPRSRLEVQDVPLGEIADRLVRGPADLAVVYPADLDLPRTIHQEPFVNNRMVCLLRRDLPGIGERLSWEEYGKLGHVVVVSGSKTFPLTVGIDRAMRRRGLERRRCLTVSSDQLLPALLMESALVATISERSADFLCEWFPLRKVEPPFRSVEYEVSLLWGKRLDEDPVHRWLRSLVRDIGEELAGGSRRGVEALCPASESDGSSPRVPLGR